MSDTTGLNRRLILKNSTANLLGQLTNKGVRILLVPLQINFLGEQAFGLLGFYALVAGFMAFLDLGLSLTANREVARLNMESTEGKREIQDLVRTFEVPYWIIGLLVGGALALSANWIVDHWIAAPDLPHATVVFAVRVIGALLAARWPVSLYRSILLGLEYQVRANGLGIAVELLNGVGTLGLLLIYPDVKLFFLWQLLLGIIEIIGYISLTWCSVRDRRSTLPRFRLDILRRVWRYALGVNTVSLLGAVFGRADGLILSKLYPITFLGYYSIAQRVPPLLGIFPASSIPATTPSLVAQYERGDEPEMSRLYHRQMRWLSFISAGMAGALATFSLPILLLWTQSRTVADATAVSFALVAVGAALETMTNPVNQLSLACGFTRPPIIVNFLTGIIVAVGTLILAPRLGIAGAALAWLIARIAMYFVFPVLVHRSVLKSEVRPWFLGDTLPFLIVAAITFGSTNIAHQRFARFSDGLLWIPLLLLAAGLYVALVLWINLLPDWRAMIASAGRRRHQVNS